MPTVAPTSPGPTSGACLRPSCSLVCKKLFSSLCLQGTAKCSACPSPCQQHLTARDHCLLSSLGNKPLGGGRGEPARKGEAGDRGHDLFIPLAKRPRHLQGWGSRAEVFCKGKKWCWDPLRDPGLEWGQDKELLCFT